MRENGPLRGPTGSILNRQLYEAGLPRASLYITNQVKCETPGNRPPTALEVQCCRPIIDAELRTIKARTIVCAGDYPWSAYVGNYSTYQQYKVPYSPKNKIMERFGCPEEKSGRVWIPTVHPSGIMYQPKLWDKAVDTLRKARQIGDLVFERVKAGLSPLPKLDFNIWPTDAEVRDANDAIISAGEFADDFETAQSILNTEDDYIGGDYVPTMLGISWAPRQAILIRPDQIPLLRPAFENENVWRYEWNGSFDDFYLRREGINSKNKRFDAMLGHHYCRSYEWKRLKPEGVQLYTTLPFWDRKLAPINEPFYCCLDSCGTLEAAKNILGRMKGLGVSDCYWEFGQPILDELEEWRVKGLNCDMRRALLFMSVLKARIAEARKLIAKLVGPTFNPNSTVQTQNLLYEMWKLPRQTKKVRDKATGGVSTRITTDNEAKLKLKAWINASAERQKMYSTPKLFLDLSDYVVGEEAKLEVLERISPDGKLHAHWKAHGASSFRLSSSPNLQNLPKHDLVKWGTSQQPKGQSPIAGDISTSMGSLRSIIIPDDPEQDVILSIDFEQIEIWMYAVLFKVKWLLEMFHSKEYLYGVIFERMLKRPFFQEGKPRLKEYKLTSVSETELRAIKTVPLGYNYGRDDSAIAAQYGLPIGEVKKIGAWWFETNPEIRQAHNYMRYQMNQQGFVRHRFGNIVWFPTRKATEVYNSHGQSPSAFVLLGTILACREEFKRREYKNTRMIMSVHDSISFNIPVDHVPEVYEEVISPAANRQIKQLDNFSFRHTADISKRLDWEETKYEQWKRESRGASGLSDRAVEKHGEARGEIF